MGSQPEREREQQLDLGLRPWENDLPLREDMRSATIQQEEFFYGVDGLPSLTTPPKVTPATEMEAAMTAVSFDDRLR